MPKSIERTIGAFVVLIIGAVEIVILSVIVYLISGTQMTFRESVNFAVAFVFFQGFFIWGACLVVQEFRKWCRRR